MNPPLPAKLWEWGRGRGPTRQAYSALAAKMRLAFSRVLRGLRAQTFEQPARRREEGHTSTADLEDQRAPVAVLLFDAALRNQAGAPSARREIGLAESDLQELTLAQASPETIQAD